MGASGSEKGGGLFLYEADAGSMNIRFRVVNCKKYTLKHDKFYSRQLECGICLA